MTLFPREELRVVGIAPLTSMFLFDETNRGRLDDYRPEVHDSDGLQVLTASGESVWRPLANPAKLQVSTFTTQAPQGFGLIQRSRVMSDFQDLDAHMSAGQALGSSPAASGARVLSSSSKYPRGVRPTTISWRFGGRRKPSPRGIRRISPTTSPGLRNQAAQGLRRNRVDALGRESRRQTARLPNRLHRRRRADRGVADRRGASAGKLSNSNSCRTRRSMGCAQVSSSTRTARI